MPRLRCEGAGWLHSRGSRRTLELAQASQGEGRCPVSNWQTPRGTIWAGTKGKLKFDPYKLPHERTARRVGSYAEAAFFDGNACQHCADRDEQQRLARKRQAAVSHYRRSKAR